MRITRILGKLCNVLRPEDSMAQAQCTRSKKSSEEMDISLLVDFFGWLQIEENLNSKGLT